MISRNQKQTQNTIKNSLANTIVISEVQRVTDAFTDQQTSNNLTDDTIEKAVAIFVESHRRRDTRPSRGFETLVAAATAIACRAHSIPLRIAEDIVPVNGVDAGSVWKEHRQMSSDTGELHSPVSADRVP